MLNLELLQQCTRE